MSDHPQQYQLEARRMTFPYDNCVQNSEKDVHVVVDNGSREVEVLKKQLEKEKQMNKKLLTNIKKIKKKMIDVSSLIELHDGLKKRIEEQNIELQKFYNQNQVLSNEIATLRKTKPQSNDSSSEQLAQLQKLRFEKVELESKVRILKEQIERVNSEKYEQKKQFENEEKKWKKQEATVQQVEQLRAMFTQAQKELTELRGKKGFMSYADFAVVKPTITEEKEKKVCKSIAVNTEASLLEKYIAQKYPSRAVSTSKPKDVMVVDTVQDDDFEPLGSMDTSFDSFVPQSSKTVTVPPKSQPTLPVQPLTVTTTATTNLKRKNEEKEKEKQFESKLKKMRKPTSEEFEEVVQSGKSVSTSPIVQMQTPSHIPIVEKRFNKDVVVVPVEKTREIMPPPKVTISTPAATTTPKELPTPQLPLIYFEKLENQTVETYIENIFINFICKFEPFINETKHQSSLLGDVNRACKNIWKQYPNHTNDIAKGVLTILAKLIASKASCEKWGLCIILLDHMDIYSFSNQLLETIFANLYISITSFITGIETSEQAFKKLMALLAGISTISNAKFARLDFCMFSKVKEVFFYILQYSLQNTRNKFGMIKYSNFQFLLAMITSNKRLLTNGFDTYSPIDVTVNYAFWSIQTKLISSQTLLDADSNKSIEDIEKLRDLYTNKEHVQTLSPDTLSQSIIAGIVSATDELSITQASNALILLTCLIDDWNFTFNGVILSGLWPLILQCLNEGGSKLLPVLSIITKLAIHRSQQIPLVNKPNQCEWDNYEIYHDGLGDLLEKFKSILMLENIFTIESSKLIAEAIIEIVLNRVALSNLVPYQEKREHFIQSLKPYLDSAKEWIEKHKVESDLFKIINV